MRFIFALFVLLTYNAFTADALAEIDTAARAYLAAHGSDADGKAWANAWAKRLTDPEAEQEGEELFTRRAVLNWFTANRGLFSNPNEIDAATMVTACRWFVLMRDKGFALPSQLMDRLTDDVARQIVVALRVMR
jgi:hypothetical protein